MRCYDTHMAARKRTNRRPEPAQRIALENVHQLFQDKLPVLKENLTQHPCLLDAWNALSYAGCSERDLYCYLTNVALGFDSHKRLRSDPVRMDSKRLRSLVGKTSWVARQWEQEFQSLFGKEVMRFAAERDPFAGEEEFLNIPRRLFSLAGWAKDIHSKTEHQKRPLYDDALAELTEYVKLKTRDYHDPEVSALVSFATRRESFCETTLRVWRCSKKDALERARLRLAQR